MSLSLPSVFKKGELMNKPLFQSIAPLAGAAVLVMALPIMAADLAALPESKPGKAEMIDLGRQLFFDNRLSGDLGLSCATCHDPAKGWGDGQPLSRGYPSMEYFRNAPSLLNARHRVRFMWDGRLDGSDAGTLVRDMVTETHFMNADGRLVQERLKQVPEYVVLWEKAFGKGSDPYGPRMFNAIGEFVKSVESRNVPFDRFLKGDAGAMSGEAREGYDLFKGKAGCVACHNGPIGSDGRFYRTGVPENPDLLKNPLRTITLLRHYATSGMPNYMNARTDLGLYAITKNPGDKGKFQTAPLRDLKYTAPYMHNGMLATLDDVIDFYDRGGGNGSELKPLNLSGSEKRALAAFLLSLSGDPVTVAAPAMPEMKPRVYGKN
jgi:cytochrome c peroxidase